MMTRLIAFLALFLFLPVAACGEEDHPRPFNADLDGMEQVESGLAEARANDKRLLLVLGANWCHDSRAFAHHLEDPHLAAIIEENYVLRLIDVGLRDRHHDVMQRFGVTAIYATPTIFIIDPEDEFLLNRHNMSDWTTAASRQIDEALHYFTAWADAEYGDDGLIVASVVYQSMLTEIEVFEAEEGARLAQAYIDIANWRALPEAEQPEDLDARIREVDEWRLSMVPRVRDLYVNALFQAENALDSFAAGEEITLEMISAFDQTDPDLPLQIERHESEIW